MGSLPVVGAILLAVLGLVWLAARLGFADQPNSPVRAELDALLDGLPGGFSCQHDITCPQSGGALAVDAGENAGQWTAWLGRATGDK